VKGLLLGLVVAVLLIAAAGVAIGVRTSSGDVDGTVTLTVTRDFGASSVGTASPGGAKDGDTVMRLLQRDYDVRTRYGGGFVQEIDGLSGGRLYGRPVDWFYYVNGIEAATGAAQRRLAPGDDVWWDRHVWQAAQRIPAVVGSFPEPFVAGDEGRRIPVQLICQGEERSCAEVSQRLTDAGATGVARSTVPLTGGQGKGVLRVIVGPWSAVREDPVARTIEGGPQTSGVFARFSKDGHRLMLLDQLGNAVRTIGGGGGLIAATAQSDQRPTWVVTGTDDVGVDAAAAALQEDRLSRHFALALDSGRDVALPTAAPGNGP
jgi:Domain of unknown function (DUF4430)